jgi:hypothetical protein
VAAMSRPSYCNIHTRCIIFNKNARIAYPHRLSASLIRIAYPHRLSDQTSAVPRPVFNGGPALLARKPVLLPVRRFLQHGFEFLALAAPERAHLIVIVSHCIVFIALLRYCVIALLRFMQVLYGFFYISFFEK